MELFDPRMRSKLQPLVLKVFALTQFVVAYALLDNGEPL